MTGRFDDFFARHLSAAPVLAIAGGWRAGQTVGGGMVALTALAGVSYEHDVRGMRRTARRCLPLGPPNFPGLLHPRLRFVDEVEQERCPLLPEAKESTRSCRPRLRGALPSVFRPRRID